MSHHAQALAYRRDIDGLRGIAILLVVLYHANAGVPGGFVGVDVFFVISGFLITRLIQREQEQGTFQLREFWARRIRRLLPALSVSVLLTLIIGYHTCWPQEYADLGASAIAQQLLGANIYFWRTSGYFQLNVDLKPLLHTWSLAVEEQYYLLLPVLLVRLARGGRARTLTILYMLLVGSLALSIWALPRFPGATFYLLPTRAWELLTGALLAMQAPSLGLSTWQRNWLGLASFASIAASALLLGPTSSFPGVNALAPVLGACGLIAAGTGGSSWSSRVLSWRPLVGLGLISYSLYLLHWPALSLARNYQGELLSTSTALWVVAASVILAYGMWRMVELPMRRADGPLRGRRSWAMFAVASMLLCAAGLVIWRGAGLRGRFSSEVLHALDARQDASCLHEGEPGELAAGTAPRLGLRHAKQSCLLWGDSFAMALAPGLDVVCRDLGVELVQVTRSMTPPMVNMVHPRALRGETTGPAMAKEVLDWVSVNRPVVAVLCAAWHWYYAMPGMEAHLRSTCETLRGQGTHVVVVMNTPRFRADLPGTIARALRSGNDAATLVSDFVEGAGDAQAIVALLNRASAGVAEPVDLGKLFNIPDGSVRVWHEGRLLFRDNGHLSVAGSLFVANELRNVLSRIVEASSAPNPQHPSRVAPSPK